MLCSMPQRLVAISCLCGLVFSAALWAATPLSQNASPSFTQRAGNGWDPQNRRALASQIAQNRRDPGALALGTPASGVWLDVPFIKQEKDGCGAASIAMVMQYWLKTRG